jgi:hypothetical protein
LLLFFKIETKKRDENHHKLLEHDSPWKQQQQNKSKEINYANLTLTYLYISENFSFRKICERSRRGRNFSHKFIIFVIENVQNRIQLFGINIKIHSGTCFRISLPPALPLYSPGKTNENLWKFHSTLHYRS